MEIRIEYVKITELYRWPRNPKDHDIGAIQQSISRFGFVNPIIIDENTGSIVAGHGRLDTLMLMQKNGMHKPTGIKCGDDDIWQAPVVRGVYFDERDTEAYILADNKLTELGGWDQNNLDQILKELMVDGTDNLIGTGFDPDDLFEYDEEEEDKKKKTCPHCGKEI